MKYSIRKLTGRCLNGAELDKGKHFHLVVGGIYGKAICGRRPGRTSNGFSQDEGAMVNCPSCVKKIKKGIVCDF
jgi:hypothetical protein